MTMPLSASGSSPAIVIRLMVSRQLKPASTRMLVFELDRTVLLPRLPLARTVILTGISQREEYFRLLWILKRNQQPLSATAARQAYSRASSDPVVVFRRVSSTAQQHPHGRSGTGCGPTHGGSI